MNRWKIILGLVILALVMTFVFLNKEFLCHKEHITLNFFFLKYELPVLAKGALLVGFSFAKSFAFARQLPFAGVNHLEAHIYSLFLIDKKPEFPFIALVVSGGHTNIYHVTSPDNFELMGQTRDDAAGEAFDKVAKMLGLG